MAGRGEYCGKTLLSGVFYKFTPEDHSGLTKDCLVMAEVKEGKWNLIK